MTLQAVIEELRTARRPTLVLEPDPGRPGRMAMLSGSFDPVTSGHAALAEAAAAHAEVVALVYSVRTIPKAVEPAPLLAEATRLDMLRRYCEARPGHVVGLCSHGLLVDQVTAGRDRLPGTELSLVMGSDKVLQLLDPAWYPDRDSALGRLFEGLEVLYAVREGEEEAVREALAAPSNAPWRARFHRLDVAGDVAAVSSSLVREALHRGEDVRRLVPPELLQYLPPRFARPGRLGED